MTRIQLSTIMALVLTASLLAVPAFAANSQTWLKKGLDQLKRNDYDAAEKSFKKAIKAAEGDCGECQLGLAMVYSRTSKLKKGEKAAKAAIASLRGQESEFLAHGELGRLCMQWAKRRSSKLDCAVKAFRSAYEASDQQSKNALFYLGWALVKKGEDAEGVATLTSFVDSYPDDENADFAQRLIENPLRGRKDLLPPFQLVTLRGKPLSSVDLEGQVLLLDFWATWCGPCRTAIPSLRDLAKKHESDPFMLISLSSDSDEMKVRDFVLDERLSWPQVWDGRERWGKENLEILKIPTYVLVGADGEVLYRTTGSSARVESELRRRVAQAIRDAKKSSS